MGKKRVLSGIRATGRLHIGNYLGAVKGMLELQDDPKYETFYMVADLHSINTPYNAGTFQEKVRGVILDYFSAGLDPNTSVIFIQSQIPEHVELSYLLSSVLTVARMLHLPTYKDKIKEESQNANMAMLYYPVLMASDILIYKANAVPVGDDQLPHLEVAREVARKMNEKYKTDFPEPEQFKTQGRSVPSLIGEGKMSKSIEGSYISLTDDLETIKKKLAVVPTDSGLGNLEGPGKTNIEIFVGKPDKSGYQFIDKKTGKSSPGLFILFKLMNLYYPEEQVQEYLHKYETEGLRYKELKEELAEAIYKELKPIQERRKEFENKEEYIDQILTEGAKKARKIAEETLLEVKEKMGLR